VNWVNTSWSCCSCRRVSRPGDGTGGIIGISIVIAEGLGILTDPFHESVRITASDLIWTTASAMFATGVAVLIVIMRSRSKGEG